MPKTLKKNHNLLFLGMAILLVLPSLIGLIHQGFPLTDDGNWMIIRFSAFYETLRSGQFPVRFLMRLNNGYGYPVADFLYPLFMYLGVFIHILKFNFIDTIKVILALSLVLSSAFTYLWLRKIFDNLSSMVGAVFYALFPYYLYDVYKRGSVGEVLALCIVPLILWQIERKSILFASLSIALLILAHNTLALLFLPVIFIYIILRSKKLFKFALLTLFFGFLISAFFWVPALYDTRYTVFAATSVSDFYNYFLNLQSINILGLITLIILISSITLLVIKPKENKPSRIFVLSFIFSLVTIFFVLPVSRLLWSFIPFTNLIQFPFRLISILIVLLTFQVAFLINSFKKWGKILVSLVFLVLIYISAKPFLTPVAYQYLPDTFYSTNQDTTTVKNEYMPKWVKEVPVSMYSSKVEVLKGRESIILLQATPNRTVFRLFAPAKTLVRVNTIYFPGWTAFVNGKLTEISFNNARGLIQLNLNKGVNNVSVVFSETTLRLVSDLLSLIGLAGIFIVFLLKRNKKIKI